jgi:glucose/arabinose dehydrogenase
MRHCLLLLMFLSACAETPTPESPQPGLSAQPVESAGGTPVFLPSATASPSAPSSSAPGASTLPVNATVSVATVVGGLDTPWDMAFAPDGTIFISERPGRIRTVRNGKLDPEPWLEIAVYEQGEAGLMGLALDPDFATNGYLYAAATQRVGQDIYNRLLRLKADPATGKGSLDQVLVDRIPAQNNHNGGRIRMGPDGKIYWGMGEIFEGERAQDINSPSGKILRVERNGAIPSDNPFENSYVWSMGHRNPQGLVWSPSGQLYSTEHGPSGEKGCCQDEINRIEKGQNYGWPIISGDESQGLLKTPLLHSGDTTTWAPAGMTWVTQGPWAGHLLFASLRGQTLFRLSLSEDGTAAARLAQHFPRQLGRLRDVQQAPDGTLYLLTSNRDGRGSPGPEDDRLLRIVFE